MWATAAPARAASIAASAICSGRTGTRSLAPVVSPAPVTAQVMKTSWFTRGSGGGGSRETRFCPARGARATRPPRTTAGAGTAASGGGGLDGPRAALDLAARVLHVGAADGVHVAVEVALLRRVAHQQRRELEQAQADVGQPLAAALLPLAGDERRGREGERAERVDGEVRLVGNDLDDPERVVGQGAVARVDRAGGADLLRRRRALDAGELRERGHEERADGVVGRTVEGRVDRAGHGHRVVSSVRA